MDMPLQSALLRLASHRGRNSYISSACSQHEMNFLLIDSLGVTTCTWLKERRTRMQFSEPSMECTLLAARSVAHSTCGHQSTLAGREAFK